MDLHLGCASDLLGNTCQEDICIWYSTLEAYSTRLFPGKQTRWPLFGQHWQNSEDVKTGAAGNA